MKKKQHDLISLFVAVKSSIDAYVILEDHQLR